MKIKDITDYLETIAPLPYQESYDNSGLIVGDSSALVKKVLITLDVTEAVVEEAIRDKCQLIIAHHPIVFGGLKKLNGKNYVERVVIKAIKNNIAIYAIHTNYDNVIEGVNAKICERLGLVDCEILVPKKQLLKKLYTFIPVAHHEKVAKAVFDAGAGYIGNYSETSFNATGTGTFKGNENSNPVLGKKGVLEKAEEIKFETIFPAAIESKVIKALLNAHPYEEVAYDIVALDNAYAKVGSGMVGNLKKEADALTFLKSVKKSLKTEVIRHTELLTKPIKRVAVCGGAGRFLLNNAIAAGADLFITADFKYHDFFDADNKIVIADVGHYESEQFTRDLLLQHLSEKFPILAARISIVNTNPIKYL
ncbi:MAG: Nif3-like dinuclear metal center hexameric protein [Chitinophagales bacterium]|nr:Nif3-like dinuclear metal center hexameric protein [Chitinophagales bacterium]